MFKKVRKIIPIIVVSAALFLGGFLAFWLNLPAENSTRIENAEGRGIVVFTGGSKRIQEAFHQLQEGFEGPVLITGVDEVVSEDMLLHDVPKNVHSQITLDYTAMTTRDNVAATKRWADMENLNDLVVITSSYHMPRSLLVLKQGGWRGTIYAAAVEPDYLPFTFLLREYVKFLLAFVHII